LNEREAKDFLKRYDGKKYVNRFGVVSRMDGMTPNGLFVYMEVLVDPQADATHPSRVGCWGHVTVACLREGRIWKECS